MACRIFSQLSELHVEVLILHGPLLAVLRIEDVVVGIVDDLRLVSLRQGSLAANRQTDEGQRADGEALHFQDGAAHGSVLLFHGGCSLQVHRTLSR
ncbi:MAG: hypothetical protein ACREIS_04520 [Nitrospiraceae bacterium]